MKKRMIWLAAAGLAAVSVSQASAQRSKPAPAPTRIQFVRWTEPREHAFSLEVPRGWSVQGQLTYLSPIDPQSFVRVQSPDKKITVVFGDPELLTREVPTQMGRMQAGVNEGQIFRTQTGGPAMLQRYMTGREYAKAHVTWRLCPNPKWVVERDLPDVSRAMAAAIAPEAARYNLRVNASSGQATFTCGTAQGGLDATTILVGEGGPIQMWSVYRVAGFQSGDPLRTMEARYVMEHMSASHVVDPAWQAALDEKARQLTGAVMSMQNAAVQASLAASRQQNETLARLNHPNTFTPNRGGGGGRGRSGSGSEVNTTLGTARVCDAIGRCATVSTSNDSYYMDHSGNVRAGTTSGSAPDNTGVWSRLYTGG